MRYAPSDGRRLRALATLLLDEVLGSVGNAGLFADAVNVPVLQAAIRVSLSIHATEAYVMPRIGSMLRTGRNTIEALDALRLLLVQLSECGLIPAQIYAHLNFVIMQMRAVVPITERAVTVNAISEADLHRRHANVQIEARLPAAHLEQA